MSQGVLSRTIVSTAGMVVQGAARFVYTLAIGRIAGEESLGEVSTILSLAVFASLFWPAATGVAASRFIPSQGARGSAVRWLKRSLLVSVSVLSVLSVVAAIAMDQDVAQAIGAAALVIGYSGYVFVRGVLLGADRIVRAAIVDLITSFVAIGALLLVLLGKLDWALLLPLALAYAMFAAMSWPGTDRGIALPDRRERRELLLFARDSAISLVATGALLPATMILVGATESKTVAGIFAAGLSLATPANLVAQSVNQVLVPHFARMVAAGDTTIRRSQQRLLAVTALGFSLVFGLIILLAPWILGLFFGARYASGALSMQVLLLAVWLMSVMSVPGAYLVAVGRQRVYARIWLVSTTVGLAVMAVAAPFLGQWGALAGFTLGAAGGSIAVIIAGLVLPPQVHVTPSAVQ